MKTLKNEQTNLIYMMIFFFFSYISGYIDFGIGKNPQSYIASSKSNQIPLDCIILILVITINN